ncbi:MAG TPA: aminotransferase class V-fold PLP-dependent enzyme [Spirochaetia bacterium]|nr:aminotransferase class V-fold PLP-dependent enzyme [Spirochaetia bacterium]
MESQEQYLRNWLDAHRVVNASGTMTSLGASSVSPEVAAAVEVALPYFIDMHELQAFASTWIARLTGAEAGCVSASAAAGIAVSVAACVAGSDMSVVEALPDLPAERRKQVVLQKGHEVDFGASISQMIRLGGASVREVGTAIGCQPHHLEGALTRDTAAALFVVSHHTVQSGMLGFRDFVKICHAKGVPVIVDAASEYDLRIFINQGADIALYSAHKFLGGPTAGIVAGKKELVRSCYINQSVGIGRAMKVGKESIVGTIAALRRWQSVDHKGLHREEYAKVCAIRDALAAEEGIHVEEVPDPTGNPITRLRITPSGGPEAAAQLASLLGQGRPRIVVRGHHVDLGFFELDPCNLMDGDVGVIVGRLREAAASMRAGKKTSTAGSLGPRKSGYYDDGVPAVDPLIVPWEFETPVPSARESELLDWPDRYNDK